MSATMLLSWEHHNDGDRPEQYVADSGEHTYIVRFFEVGAHDGAPGLWIHDDKYRSTCWQLIVWVGNTMKGPSLLFDELADALLAAQDKEDKVRQTR